MRRRDSKSFSRELHYHPPMRKIEDAPRRRRGCGVRRGDPRWPEAQRSSDGKRGRRRRLLRHQGAGSVSLDGGPRLQRGGRLGRGGERRHLALSRNAADARQAQGADHRSCGTTRRSGTPFIESRTLFYRRNSGLQQQSPLYVRASLDGAADARARSESALAGRHRSSLAGTSPVAGRRAARLHDVGRRRRLADRPRPRSRDAASDRATWSSGCASPGFAWTKDSKGFFYSRYPEPPAGKVLEAALSGQALYYHRVGTPQSEDRLIYERKDLPTWFIGGDVTEDGRYLLDHASPRAPTTRTASTSPISAIRCSPNIAAPVTPVVETDDAEYAPIGNDGSVAVPAHRLDAPNRRIIADRSDKRDRSAWKTVVPRASAGDREPRLMAAAGSSRNISWTCRAG